MTQATATKEKTAAAAAAAAEESRKRFSFGPVWSKNVIAGKVKDHEKLLAHAVKLKIGTKSELKRISLERLIAKVGETLKTTKQDEKETEAA